jgi:hypothetical protein
MEYLHLLDSVILRCQFSNLGWQRHLVQQEELKLPQSGPLLKIEENASFI